MVRRVSVQGRGGAVLDIDITTSTTGGWVVVNELRGVGRVVAPAAIEDLAEQGGGFANLILKACVLGVATAGIGTGKASCLGVLPVIGPGIGDQALFFFQ